MVGPLKKKGPNYQGLYLEVDDSWVSSLNYKRFHKDPSYDVEKKKLV